MFSTERKQYIDSLSIIKEVQNVEEPSSEEPSSEPMTEPSSEPRTEPSSGPEPEPRSEPRTKPDWKTNIQSRTFHAKHVQDSLFGSIYMAHHGYDAFKRVAHVFGKTDNEEKKKIIDYLQTQCPKKMNELVNYNLTKVLYDKIMHDLSTCPETPYHCVIGLCLYYKCSIYIVDTVANTYITFIHTETENIHVLFKNPNAIKKKMSVPSYFVDTSENCISIAEIHDTFFKLFHYTKPLQSIASYKLNDLETIAQKLNISYEKKMKKKELYEKIYARCGWN